jgi:hypothetical protein
MSNKGVPVGKRYRLYGVWKGMKSRCHTKSSTSYPNYGGRGIRVCPEWHDFRTFRAYVIAHLLPPGETDIPKGLDVDRFPNNDGHYEPGNVRLATRSVNVGHGRRAIKITIGGETKSLTEWCRVYGKTTTCVRYRVDVLGWGHERALAEPLQPKLATGHRHPRKPGVVPKSTKGSNHWKAKLTEEKVREAKREHASGGVTIANLARRYGVSRGLLSRILSGHRWQHVAWVVTD